MALQDQSPTTPRNVSRPDPQTPIADMVTGRINVLMRERTGLANKLADAKLKHECLERTFNDVRQELQIKFKGLEDTIEQLRLENEEIDSLNGSLEVWVAELKNDLIAARTLLDTTRQEFQQSHVAISDAYRRLEDVSVKTKTGLQRAWAECKQLQEENDALTEQDAQHSLENHELRRINDLLHDELQWYETQEKVWMDNDRLNQSRFAKLNAEILAHLHVYGQLADEKAKNQALIEENGRLRYDLDKLRQDVKADKRIMVMKGLSMK